VQNPLPDELFFPILLVVGVIVVLVIRLVSASARINDLCTNVNDLAMQRFNAWKQTELDSVKRQAVDAASGEAGLSLQQWKLASERSIRADAHQRSKAVTTGKVLEHIAPHLPGFPFNPKDARFLGSPVDYVVFDGLDEGAIQQVVFVEVKTGDSALTARQKRIKEVIESGRVKWYDLRIPNGPAALRNAAGPLTPPRPASASAPSKVVLPELGDVTNEATIVHWGDSQLHTGMQVRHPEFGVGTVIAVEERNDYLLVTVRFARFGVKKLHTKYAKLWPA
jgi:predicted Holliday junction resolvase-like endonuclease